MRWRSRRDRMLARVEAASLSSGPRLRSLSIRLPSCARRTHEGAREQPRGRDLERPLRAAVESQQDRNYERSRGIWTNLFGGSKKNSEEIAKNKRCYANTLRPCSRMLLKVMKGSEGGHYPPGSS